MIRHRPGSLSKARVGFNIKLAVKDFLEDLQSQWSSKQHIAEPAFTWHGAAAANHAHGSLDSRIGGALLLLIVGFGALRGCPCAVLAQRPQPIFQLLHDGGLVLDSAEGVSCADV